jgi:hypothetical protein
MLNEFNKGKVEKKEFEREHFPEKDFNNFLKGELGAWQRSMIIMHLVKTRCKRCMCFLAEKINEQTDEASRLSKFKYTLHLIDGKMQNIPANRFEFVLANKDFCTKEEMLSDLFEFVCDIGIEDYVYPNVLKSVAVRLFEQALASTKTTAMICESGNADKIKDGIMNAIADTIAFLQ